MSSFTSVSLIDAAPPLMTFTGGGIHFLQDGNFELHSAGKPEKINNTITQFELKGAWQLAFPKGWGAPQQASFPELISWTKAAQPGIKYFSGIATYTQVFSFVGKAGSNERIYLDLGDLSKVAEVWLNNRPLGITWSKPYSFDVTGLLKNGKNMIRIEVANTWSNRLIGDALTGEKFTNTNITMVGKVPWARMPLQEAGLMGPVTLKTRKLVN